MTPAAASAAWARDGVRRARTGRGEAETAHGDRPPRRSRRLRAGGLGSRRAPRMHGMRAAYVISTIRSDRAAGAGGQLRVHRHAVAHVAQRVAQLLERDHLHVPAHGPLAHRVEALVRRLLAQPVQDAGLGRDHELRARARLRARCTIPSVESTCVVARRVPASSTAAYMHWLAQPHSGWISRSASGPLVAASLATSSGRMPAWTWHSPGQIFILRPVTRSRYAPRNMSGRNRISRSAGTASITCAGVARRAAVVRQRLHLGGRVDVADDHGARVLGLPARQRLGVDRWRPASSRRPGRGSARSSRARGSRPSRP